MELMEELAGTVSPPHRVSGIKLGLRDKGFCLLSHLASPT